MAKYFDSVDPKPDFPKMEKKLADQWYRNGVVKKYLQKNNSSKKMFSFLDGPITANNPMAVHHAWGRTYKDLWQRFKNMQGFKQRFQNGFDCQGLWVEVEVEKELGLKSKKEIENLVPEEKKASVDKFVELCKERAVKYAKIQTEQSQRLGYFMDWENSYFTLSDENNYMIWYFLKKCHEKGLIYKGHDVVPWCPRCETAISEHEILTEDYKEITHESIFLKYPIQGKKNEYLLIWTTTPWTLPANIAVTVEEKLDYVLVELARGEKLWIAEKLKNQVLGKEGRVIKRVKGRNLVGLKYRGPFDALPAAAVAKKFENFHTVVAADSLIMPVSEKEGTGLVHTSTGTGAEDFKLGQKLGLPVISATADNADYLPNFGFLAGKNAKKQPELIINYLKDYEGGRYLFKTLSYTHRYPACWRCKSELIWKVADEWYIAIDPVREEMKEAAKRIKWIPKFGLKRELDWLHNMHDWLISKKNRYWGLALPVWECKKCKSFEVVGSIAELKEKAVEGWDKFQGHSPHKPWIDEVKVRCSKCQKTIERIPDVGNPWLDAGIVTYSTISEDNKSKSLYLTDKSAWGKWAPADFITESFPGQFKNWFYSLIAMSTVLENMEPARSVLGFATCLGEDGRPMHKSWGNSIEFNEAADKIGVDVMRWLYVRQNPAENLLFGYKVTDETRRKFHLKLWNVYNFFVTYANLDGWRPAEDTRYPTLNTKNILDNWIITRLNQVIKSATENLEKYDAYTASAEIEKFVDDLSLWYIRRSRERVGPAAESEKDKENFYQTCHLLLVTLSKLLAPFTPFLAEIIYRNLTKEESVHLIQWPEEERKIDIDLIEQMGYIREIVERIHAERKEQGIPVRQPLSAGEVISDRIVPSVELIKIAKDELNIKAINFKRGRELKVSLDAKITPELEQEAKTRELMRKIQEERKKLGMNLAQEVNVWNEWLPKDNKLVQWLCRKAQIQRLKIGVFRVEKHA